MLILADIPHLMWRVLALALGLIWGSFLNVVIYRVPLGMSVVSPPSHCPHCGARIAPWDNIPVLSWLLLRGKSRCCRKPISPRYMLVEILGGVLSLAVLEANVLTLPPDTPLTVAGAVYASGFTLAMTLTALAFIDMEHLIVPDRIAWALVIVGLGTWWLRPPLTIEDALLSAAGGYLLVWLGFGVLYRLVRGRTGMGLGDATLLAVAGAWFGWRGLLFTLMAASVQGTVVMGLMFLVKGDVEEPEVVARERQRMLEMLDAAETEEERAELERLLDKDPVMEELGEGLGGVRVPFGPFLALAMMEYLLAGTALLERYLPWLILPW